jgi:hypothetical protein
VTAHASIEESSAGLLPSADPLGIAAGAGGRVWFTDLSGAIGEIDAQGQVSESTAGLPTGSSPVAISAGADGNMWFSDEGTTPAIGRISPGPTVREFSAGLQPGSQPALLAPAADGRLWFSDEGSTAAIGQVSVGVAPALRARPVVRRLRGRRLRCRAPRWATWSGALPSIREHRFDGDTWLRDGVAIPGRHAPTLSVPGRDGGTPLACRVTATYPPPLDVTATALSAPVVVGPGR